uniref:Small ribosomal subunit protein uS8c n=1 Tax=Haptophyceae sp. NIES-3900 TaxID=2748608 RepID=A0A7R6WFC8_9EUKA|nr:ribosomal protein S8 [Haptophyceae sp. NIES-3900]
MSTDTISDMLTRLRNANLAKHQIVQLPSTKLTRNICDVLKEEGFLGSLEEISENNINYLLVSLRYKGKSRVPIISTLKRISKPGLRVYVNHKEIPRVLDGLGIAIMSTSKGLMTGEKAKINNLGGEVLCYVW